MVITRKITFHNLNIKLPLSFSLQFPNSLSVLWILLCINTLSMLTGIFPNIAFYCFASMVVFVDFIKNIKRKFEKSDKCHIAILFCVLLFLQMVGTVQVFSAFSFRNLLSTLCVFCLIDFISFKWHKIQILYFRISYYSVMALAFYKSLTGIYLGNTLPGCIMFLTLGYLVIEYTARFTGSDKLHGAFIINSNEKVSIYRDMLLLIISLFICYRSHARTALFTLILVLLAFIFLRTFFDSRRATINYKLINLFWVLAGTVVLFMLFYINMHAFTWYNDLNAYSVMYFGKNIDSGRSLIWSTSYDSLSFWQVVTGAGTGKLPDIERYIGTSFHNSFFQLFMQNGLLGLSCLVFILWTIWKTIALNCYDTIQKFLLSVFIGILIYNCFETTLLQNKTFLGVIQWFILSIGVLRSNLLRKQINEDS